MKKFKGILSFALTLVMVLSSFSNVIAAEFSDVQEKSPFKEAIYTLADFKILLGDAGATTFRPDANISREEFSVIMTRVLGLGALNVNVTEYPFTDVNPNTCDDWSIKATKLAYDLGIIKGMGDGTFAPKAPVTYEQSVKMIVCALGYESAAIEAGGWPNGYMQVARSKGITKKTEMSQSAPAPRGIVAQLIYNSLEIDLMTQLPSVSEEPEYKILYGQNILTNYLKYTKGTGVVSGIEGTALTHAGTSIKEDEVEIESNGVYTKYKLGETNANQHFGQSINFFYKVNDDMEYELVTARPTDNNWELTIPSENIYSLNSSQIEYWEDTSDTSKTEVLPFSSDVKAIYNGKNVSSVDASITPDAGKVVVYDNDNDGHIDIIVVEASTVIVVDAIDTKNYTVYDKYDQSKKVVLDPKSKDTIVITKNGADASFGTIMKTDVLLVSESKNTTGRKIINVEIISRKIAGVITEISLDGSSISIQGKPYQCARSYLAYLEDNPSQRANIDDNITAYLDHDGKILAISISAAAEAKYGYLMNAGVDHDEEVAQFRIYTTSKTIMTYDGVSKVKINGQSTAYDEVLDKLSSTNGMTNKDSSAVNATYAQMVEYTLSGNKVATINTIKTAGDVEKNLVLSSPYNSTPAKYKSSNKSLGNSVSLSNATKVFYVPSDRKDLDAYSMTGYTSLRDGIEYNFEAYDCSQTNVASVVVIYGEAGSISVDSPNAPVALVENIVSVLDDGQPVHRMTAYINNQLKTYNSVDNTTLMPFRRGDVVKLSLNNENKISDAKLVFRPTTPPETEAARYVTAGKDAGSSDAEYLTVYGTVYGRDDERMTVSLKDIDAEGNLDGSDLYMIPFSSDVKYFVIEATSENAVKTTVGMVNDIVGYASAKTGASKVFAYSKSGKTQFVLILK